MDVGVRLQQYEVIEHIGRGGMADVWSARDTSLGRMVAIKTIAPDLSQDQDPLAMFEQEARTIANLEHPHILPIYGFGRFQGKLYIAMRYVTGGSLEDVLSDRPLSYDYALRIARSLAEALDHAHGENVVHLDLKPPNVLLDSKGVPYLADFGLATALGADGRAKNPGAGTLLYMAPEQMTSEVLDSRADIYSFTLVIYRMLTGALPFNGTTPLSLRQLQLGDQLPHLSEINASLPDELTEVLRRGTHLSPEERPASATALVREIEVAMGLAGTIIEGAAPGGRSAAGFTDLMTEFDPEKVQRREAEDIYRGAHSAWAAGNGRFLLSVTHFMVMSDFYSAAEVHGLKVDGAGLQMLLRGALEYDYDLAYWWRAQPNNDSRRWVCLHAVRSESPSARVRAYERLHTLPDIEPPVIPRQVAQALSLENNEAAALAALDVLGTRVSFPEAQADEANPRRTLIDTVLRDGLQILPGGDWHPFAYSPEIDTRIAGIALDGVTANVRAQAARTIGKMRSTAAIDSLLQASSNGERGVNRAFAYVLDEIPTLPKSVPFDVRLGAWLRNTAHRLTHNPMGIVWSVVSAMMIGWVAMGQHVYRIFRSQAIFNQQRVLNTFAVGLLFGFFLAVLTVMAKTFPERLRGFWPNWTRLVWSALSGFYLSQLLWWAYVWALLNLNSPPKDILVITGIGTAIGFVIPAMAKMRGWAAFLITTVTTFGVHYLGFTNYWSSYFGDGPLPVRFGWFNFEASFPFLSFPRLEFTDASWIFAYDTPGDVWTIMLPLIALMALGAHLPAILADIRAAFAPAQVDGLNKIELFVDDATGTSRPATNPLNIGGPRTAPRPGRGISLDQTEEYELERVGGKNTPGKPQTDIRTTRPNETDWDALLNPLAQDTTRLDTPPPTNPLNFGDTSRLDNNPSKDDAPDWDALMSPLDSRTEEYEIGQVGGRTTDNDDAPDWDALMSPLDSRTEEYEIGQVGGRTDKDEATPDDKLKGHTETIESLTEWEMLETNHIDIGSEADDDNPDDDDEIDNWDNITRKLDNPDDKT